MPTKIRNLPLYVGKRIEDLESAVDKFEMDQMSPKMVCKTLDKLYDKGERRRAMGDEEMAYIYFTRWINCIRWIRKTPDYQKNKDLLKPYTSRLLVKEIVNYLENLAKRLQDRYEAKRLKDIHDIKQLENRWIRNKLKYRRLKDSSEGIANTGEKMQIEPERTEPETTITCIEMFQEMKQLLDRIIIIDIRDKDDFQKSHVKSDQCINIPAELIRPGNVPSDIFKSLRPDGNMARILHHRAREYCDLVVLLDWQTTKASLKPANRLHLLKTILWDQDFSVVYNEILVLDGGYKEWLNCFPGISTDPKVTVPDVEGNNIEEILEEVEYPKPTQSNEDQPMINVQSKPIPERSLKRKINIEEDLISNISETSYMTNTNQVNTYAITCLAMFREMKQLLDRIIIIDIRGEDDFQKSHIKSYQCINIPAEFIRPKKLATDIFECLRPMGNGPRVIRHRSREHCDLVVLLDWQTTEASLEPANRLHLLKTILWDRDPGVAYNKILVLDGGYKEWLNCFPSITTNPKVTVPDFQENIAAKILKDWDDEYPKLTELDEDQPMINVKSKLFPERSSKPKINNKIGAIDAQTRQNICRQKNIEVESSYKETKTQLDLDIDIGIAESDVRRLAIKRKVLKRKTDKEVEENLEMRQKIMSTPPRETTPDTHKTPLKYDGPSPNGSLKRSYSSPNLVQATKLKLQDKELGSRGLDNNMPQVDRTSKPLQQLQQSKNIIANNSFTNNQPLRMDWDQRMDPVYGDVHPGITGLKNLGNSCYMNSIIQCLSNTTRLARYFIQDSYTNDLYRKNKKTDTLVVEEIAQVIKALWCGRYRSISPRDLKVTIGRYQPELDNYEQQDSHEFLTFLLHWMHNDLKTTAHLEIDRFISNAENEWDRAMHGETSIISQLFFSQLRSTISCLTCRSSSTTYENFNTLTLSVPDSLRCTLDDRMKKYLSRQRVSGWRCQNCEALRDATKKIDFIKLAPIIVVHLNRFGASDGWIQKNNTAVNFPLVSLDLTSYVVHEAGTNTTTTNSYQQRYNLYAVVNHYGTMEGGHYTSYCNSASQNEWYKYDDRTVKGVPPTEVKSETASAYLLFYTTVPTFSYM